MSISISAPCTYRITPAGSTATEKHPIVMRAELARWRRNEDFWEAYREWRQVKRDYEADTDRWRVENWADRIAAAEEKMLTIPVSSVSAVNVKLTVSDDPRSYPLPGSAGNLLCMIQWDLDRISMLEQMGIAYPGELV